MGNVVAKFFGFLPGPPQFWTLSAAATQIAGAGLLSVGFLSRPTAAAMSATMITAVVFHLLNTGAEDFPLGIPKAHSYNFELAAMYVFVLGYFAVNGAGCSRSTIWCWAVSSTSTGRSSTRPSAR